MAQVIAAHITNRTLYFIVSDSTGQYWNGSAFETYNAANIATYDVAMTEDVGLGVYRGTFPAGISAGIYEVTVKDTETGTGTSLEVSDLVVAVASFAWDGTTLREDSNTSAINNDAQSSTDLKDFADDGYDPATNKVQGVVLVDTTTVNTDMVAEAPTVIAIRTEMDSNSTQLAAIVADTNELQVDWTDGGRLDLLLDDIPTTAEFEARTILAAAYFDPAVDAVANVTLVATTTTNTDMITAAGIDTVLTSSHGAGAWTTSGGTGSGARTVTIAVDDGTTAIESAKVRVTKGGESFLAETDVNGDVNSGSGFSLDDGDWTVSITAAGFSFTPVTLAVSANTDITYSMTQVSLPASSPTLVTGFLYTYDEDGVVEAGVTVNIRFITLAGTGFAFDTAIRTATSAADGLVSFTNLFPGADYELRRETNGTWKTVTVASDASSTFALPNFWGIDE